ncbi:MAG: response regulator transcription factor [Cryobacterium sp.]|nr:response regulator transcription factor [Micrococcales bacterium]MBX3308994.1 response regulator transcription factor [Cryobacterium sp.]
MKTESLIRVVLVEDHELVRRGIAELISAESDMDVVAEAGTVAQARSRIAATNPDIVLLDVRLPDGSGIDVCRSIRQEAPQIRCLILTAYDDEDALYAAVLAGAAGYILKDIRGNRLIEAIRRVAAGHSLLDPTLKKMVTHRMREASSGEDPRLDALTGRERQVLNLIAEGLTNREIGQRINLAEKTVKNYVSNILSKLGLQRRTQAAVLGDRAHRSG